jgi:hypothetical protein
MSAQRDPVPPEQGTNGRDPHSAAPPAAGPAQAPSWPPAASQAPRFAELVRNSTPARGPVRKSAPGRRPVRNSKPARGSDSPADAGGWHAAWERLKPRSLSAAQPSQNRRIFRLPAPLIVWWIWVVFLAANVIDLALTGRDWYSVLVLAVLAVITGLMYVTALRPRVIADEDGITVQNPLCDHWVPWGSVSSVTVGESLLVRCAPGPDSDREKVVHSWALYAPRRARVKKDFPNRRQLRFAAPTPPSYANLPKDAQDLLKQSQADLIAAELELRARQARERGAAPGERVASWPWAAFAALLIPAAALVIVLLVH